MKRCLALFALALAAAAPAVAATAIPAFENSPATVSPRWTTCFVLDRTAGKKWVSDIYEGSQPVSEAAWLEYVRSKFGPSADLAGACVAEDTREDAIWRHAVLTDEDPVRPVEIVEVADWAPASARKIDASGRPLETVDAMAMADVPEPLVAAPGPAAVLAMVQPAVLNGVRTADEAEFQRQYADYQRRLAEQQRQVEAFKQAQADIARRKEEQRLAAAKAVAAYAVQMHAHDDAIRRHDAEVARYEAKIATTASFNR
jgi:hypothetical protein